MTKREKLLQAILNNPKTVRFEDACKIAAMLGFYPQGGKGSHQTYGKVGETLLLNFQNRSGYILPYQAKQLIEMVKKYATLSN